MNNLRGEENPTQREKLRINRGIELILSRRVPQKPNIILLQFEKVISLFKKELTVYFKFSLNINNSQKEE